MPITKAGLGVLHRADGGEVSISGSPEQDASPVDAGLGTPLSDQQPHIRDYVYGLGQVYGQLWDDLTRSAVPRAAGGSASASSENWMARGAMRQMQQPIHAGPINSTVAGRTDHIPLNVASGSYVVPADIVSGMGQGNTAAGHQILGKMFSSMPYGGQAAGIKTAKAPRMKFATGGAVPIMAAGGEHVLTPDEVAAVGGGDVKHGHEILDAWIKHEREKINKEQKKLPGPAKD